MTAFIDPRDPALNYVVVNGLRSPGVAKLTGVAAPYNWDIQQGYGLSGAVTVFKGRGVAKFTLTLTFWLPEHFGAWPFFAAAIQPPTKGKPLLVDMQHPILAAADIKSVAVESLGQPERQSNGTWIVTISLLENRPPLPAIVKPRGSIPAVDKGKPVTPKTEADLILEQANKRYDEAKASATGRPTP